ncbi:MAG: RNA polymerase sigma factor [Acidimicrobiia bacterium]
MESALWTVHSRDLIHYAAGLIGPTEAEDVVSSVFLRIMERQGFSSIDDPRRYLFRAVLNECRMRFRRVSRQRMLYLGNLDVVLPPELHPEVFEAVMTLPIQQRAAIYLVYWEDLSVDDTATLMDISPGTVKRYLHLARRKLRPWLESHVPEGASHAE